VGVAVLWMSLWLGVLNFWYGVVTEWYRRVEVHIIDMSIGDFPVDCCISCDYASYSKTSAQRYHNLTIHSQNEQRATTSHLYSNSSTISAIANELVKPGLSMPSRLTKPSKPSSFLITKSSKPSPPAFQTAPPLPNLGRMPL